MSPNLLLVHFYDVIIFHLQLQNFKLTLTQTVFPVEQQCQKPRNFSSVSLLSLKHDQLQHNKGSGKLFQRHRKEA